MKEKNMMRFGMGSPVGWNRRVYGYSFQARHRPRRIPPNTPAGRWNTARQILCRIPNYRPRLFHPTHAPALGSALRAAFVVLAMLSVLAGPVSAQQFDIAGNSTINICETQSYTISIVNDSGNPLTDIVVTAHLDNLVNDALEGFSYVAGTSGIDVGGTAICNLAGDDDEPAITETPPNVYDLTWNIDTRCPSNAPFTLADGQTLNITFDLYTECPSVSGSLNTTVDYVIGVTSQTDNTGAHSIQVLPGGVTITKTPDVLDLYVGDQGTWTLTVTNTGFGRIENVVVTDVLGAGLDYVNSVPAGANAGQTTTWNLGTMNAGDVTTIDLIAEVIACENLDNNADVSWGCPAVANACFDTAVDGGTATASVRRLVRTPLIEYNPPDIAFDYCSDTHNVNFTITNTGDGDAENVQIAVDFGGLAVSNVSAGAVYNDVDNRFELANPIPAAPGPGNTYNLSFDLNYNTWCGGGFPTGSLLWQTQYEDECGNIFLPPAQLSQINAPANSSDLSVAKTGAPSAIQIGSQVTYTITSEYTGPVNCGGGTTGDVTVVDTIPAGFSVVDNGGGVEGAGTITWTYTPPATLNANIILEAPDATQCDVYCFTTFDNTVAATVTDCCGCVLNAEASESSAIECEEGVDSEKTAVPGTGIRCDTIAYTNTYDFNIAGVNLNDLVFEEHAENNQQFEPGTLSVTFDGADIIGCVAVTDNTPGGSLVLDFSACGATPVNGLNLTVRYELRIPRDDPEACNGLSFYSWSSLEMGATGGLCLADGVIQETVYVGVQAPAMEVSITGLTQIIEQCETQTIQLTLAQTSSLANPRDVRLELSGLNYYVANPAGVTCAGVAPVGGCVPGEVGGNYVWTFDDAFSGAGQSATFNIEVTKRCAGGGDLVATAYYDDNCNDDAVSDDLCTATASVTPALLLSADLMIEKTPEVIYATTNQVEWTIYITNRGTGSAHNVWVDDVLGAGLRYNNATVDDLAAAVTPNQDHNGGAINGATISIPEIEPGRRRTITYVADQISCNDLTNDVTTSWGCNAVDCQVPVGDSATVEIRDPLVIATNVIDTPVDPCTRPQGRISLRNAGQTTAYDFVVTETLPAGMLYRSGTTRWRLNGGAWHGPDAAYDPNPAVSPLQWTSAEIPVIGLDTGLAVMEPRDTIEIEFEMDAWCPFQGGDATITTAYENPCGTVFNTDASTFTVAVREPVLTVDKRLDPSVPIGCGDTVTWIIDVVNTSGYMLPVVWVRDTLNVPPGGSAFAYQSSTGTAPWNIDNGVYDAVSGYVYWELRNVAHGHSVRLTLTATSDGAPPPCNPNTDNSVEVWWGCGATDGGSDTEPGTAADNADTCLAAWGGDSDVSAETRQPAVGFVTMSVAPSDINSCDEFVEFTVTISNPGPTAAFDIDLVITLPPGLTYRPGTDTSAMCVGVDNGCTPVGIADPGVVGNVLTYYDIGNVVSNLAPEIEEAGGDDTLVLQFTVEANCYATADMGLTLYYYDCCGVDQWSVNDSQEVAAMNPYLVVEKTPAVSQVGCTAGTNQQTWNIAVTNQNPDPLYTTGDAQVVRIEDTPGNWINVDMGASTAGITDMGGGVYGWEITNLVAGDTANFTLVGELSPTGYPNQADCDPALRQNNVRAIWGCGNIGDIGDPAGDGNPLTQAYDCTYGTWSDADPALLQMSDLVITAITPDFDCATGTAVSSLTATVLNQGPDASPNTTFTVQVTDGRGWTGTGTHTGAIAANTSVPVAINTPAWDYDCTGCQTFTFNGTVDLDNDVCECDESNNTYNPPDYTIPLPDLQIVAVTPSCGGDNRTIVEIEITNAGCGDLNTDFDIWIRDNEVPVHERTASFTSVGGTLPLNAGTTQTVQFRQSNGTSHLVTDCDPCDVNIIVTLDSDEDVCECDETNNETTVPYTRPPRVQAVDHDMQITCVGPGLYQVSGDVEVENVGCSAANIADFELEVRLWDQTTNADCTAWTDNFVLFSQSFGAQTFTPGDPPTTFTLGPFTGDFSGIDWDMCDATCGIGLRVTPQGVCDCQGGNSTVCDVLTPQIPDLAVEAITPSAVCATDSVTGGVQVTVRNAGCGDLTNDFQIQLQDNRGYNNTLWYNANLGGALPIVANTTANVSFTDWDPCATAPCMDPNEYDFTVALDTGGDICECDETNNAGTLNDQVFAFPDLVITAVTPNMECGGTASADVTVQNNGCATAAAGVPVRITGNIPAPVNGVTTIALANGASETITILLGDIACGTAYNITATADPDNVVCECDGTNNGNSPPEFTIACPTCAITGAPAEICDNESVTLGLNVTQGLNPGPYTYAWSDNCVGGFDDNTSATPTWTAPDIPGADPSVTCTITVEVTDSAGCVNSCQVDVDVINCVAIGNFVWFDDGSGGGTLNNGMREAGEPAVPDGTVVELYQAGANPLTTAAFQTANTAGGHYQFDNLEPGQYFVHIPFDQFDNAGDPLWNYVSSTVAGADDTDDQNADENGIDDSDPATNGISTNVFDLQPGLEPTLEPSRLSYTGNLSDDCVNMTADFGFIPAVAIGNLVWIDYGGAGADANDGERDAGEPAVPDGVVVELYLEGETVAYASTTTAGGNYIFDNIPPGRYFVHIPSSQFDQDTDPLWGYMSSTNAGADDADDENTDENGIDVADPATDGISTNVFELTPGLEPAGEPSNGSYTGNLADTSVNMTADFGLYPGVAIGNLLWFDDGAGSGIANNGIRDGGEIAVPDGVAVELYADGTNPLTTAALMTTTTTGGHYEFDNLVPGQYFVHIPPGQFDDAADPLWGYLSSTDTGAGGDNANDENTDENGIDAADPTSTGISSNTFDLQPLVEPDGEPSQVRYTGNLPDESVNMTADFGFVQYDFGDLPDTGLGTGNQDYETSLANDGPRHVLDGATFLGAGVDTDNDGQPGNDADGDDADGNDDEDGIVFLDPILPNESFDIEVTASVPGYLNMWIDFNEDGDFDDTGERVADELNVAGGTNTYTLNAPATPDPFAGTLYIRARFTSGPGQVAGPNGFAPNGEVEDYVLLGLGDLVWEDNGRGGGTTGNNGIFDGTELSIPDVELELYTSAQTPGTDTPVRTTATRANGRYWFSGMSPGEYVVHIPASEFQAGGTLNRYFSTDDPGGTAIDPDPPTENDEDVDENGEDDPDPASNGISSLPVTLTLGGEPVGGNSNPTVDFGLLQYDFGDLPDAYDTLLASTGARHVIDGETFLGPIVDAETDGQPSDGADGDDNELSDDEDGVVFQTPVMPNSPYTIDVTASANGGYLSAWIDFNGDGDFDDTDEQVYNNQPLAAGLNTLAPTAPNAAMFASTLYSRFRFTRNAGEVTTHDGVAPNGEVEDYSLASLGDLVWYDNGNGGGISNNGMREAGEPPVVGAPVWLYRQGQAPGGTPVAETTTDANGRYRFSGLNPGNYFVHIPAAAFGAGQPLENHFSSLGNGDAQGSSDENADENGIDNQSPSANGISSGTVTLTMGGEPTAEDGDPNSNLTIDFGFIESDYGDLPDSYGTTLPNGARHNIDSITWLGSRVDVEGNGVPTATATGDDASVFDDEDGVRFLTPIMPGQSYEIRVTSSADAYLNAWIDFNGNGRFDAGERITGTDRAIPAGASTLTYTAPAVAANSVGFPSTLYSRFRVTASRGQVTGPTGQAASGEVEDYALPSLGDLVWIDNGRGGGTGNNGIIDGGEAGVGNVAVELHTSAQRPGTDTPIATTSTSGSTNGAGRYRFTGLEEGNYVVYVPNGNFANGAPLYEYFSTVDASGPIDPDNDRNESADENGVDVLNPAVSGVAALPVTLALGQEPANDGDTDENSNLTVDFAFVQYDLGDLPDGPYETTLAANGARHVIDGSTWLGQIVDPDADGSPSVNADGDDMEGRDDEDGIRFLTPIMPGEPFEIQVAGSVNGFLNAWIDFNGNGVWEANERIASDTPMTAGTNTLTLTAPPSATPFGSTLYSRFRFTRDQGAVRTPYGLAGNGEAEDYSLMSLGNLVWLDNGDGGGTPNDGIRSGAEPGIPNVPVWLYATGQTPGVDQPPARTTTDSNGIYRFTGLNPGDWFVHIPGTAFDTGNSLANLYSSTGAGDSQAPADDDTDENGIDNPNPSNGGISSDMVTLTRGGEPTAEDGDPNSNMTIDFGFVESDYGDLPDVYGTLLPDAPRHVLDGVTWLGAGVDPEGNGQPGPNANGDDMSAGDDEDGVRFLTPVMSGEPFEIEVTASTNGYLNGWMDFNGDGDFDDFSLGERLFDETRLSPGVNRFTFTAPETPGPLAASLYSRFRFTSNSGEANTPTGLALNGEVEDYSLASLGNQIWLDNGQGGGDYNDGIMNGTEAGIPGALLELYRSGQTPGTVPPIATTRTDPDGGYLFTGLEPGTYFAHIPETQFRSGEPLHILYSSTGVGIPDDDIDDDGDENGIDDDFPMTNGISSGEITLTVGDEPHEDGNSNQTLDFGFMRMDFGDLPDGLYPTTMIENAARHVIDEVTFLGEGVDAESDGQPSDSADGDDLQGDPALPDDEDGIRFLDPIMPGQPFRIEVAASADGVLNAWIDYDMDGFDDRDRIANEMALPAGTTILTLNAPDSDQPFATTLYSRFRYTAGTGEATTPEGSAPSGEVEDYALLSLGDLVWLDNGEGNGGIANGILDGGETGIPDVRVQLYTSNQQPGTDTPIAETVTGADGRYRFTGLAPGNYVVHIPAGEFPTGEVLHELFSTPDQTGFDTPNNDRNEDADENGLDDADRSANGISTGVVTLALGDEPTDDGDTDANSNMTVDLGFFEPVSLGNRVWFDSNRNGFMDANEFGVANVIVNLLDISGTQIIDAAGTPVSTITDGNGHYLFDNLVPGDYLVEISYANFGSLGPLFGHLSSPVTEPEPDAGTDGNDNGIDDDTPEVNGIRSGIVRVYPDSEPVGEADLGSDGHGRVDDDNSNLTVDFGFWLPMSIGNRVWFDENDNGRIDQGEPGIPGVTVTLLDTNGEPVQFDGGPVTATTDENGYYLFDSLPEGDYIVRIDPENFAPDGPLGGLFSSRITSDDPNDDTDSDDNGIDNPNPESSGIQSGVITLATGREPVSETDLGSLGSGLATDTNSNLTVDFGFTEPVSLGNRVWLDENGNGVMDGGESGIPNVTVNLLDENGDPVPGPDGPLTTTTDENGHYIFERLTPGVYIVEIPPENFQPGGPLAGRFSSSITEEDPNADTDRNDNGLDDANPEENGIRTNTVTLEPSNEPAGETDVGFSLHGVGDSSTNLTVDFGFFVPTSLGNRIWLDEDEDGERDEGEPGIPGVTVELLDENGLAITSVVTDDSGYYLFDNLPPGNYVVRVPPANFQPGGPLYGLFSSGVTEENPNADTDENDNGLDSENPETTGVSSGVVTLAINAEPVNEPDPGPGPGSAVDAASNLTVDFGFYREYCLFAELSVASVTSSGTACEEDGALSGTVVVVVANTGLADASGAIVRLESFCGYVFDDLEIDVPARGSAEAIFTFTPDCDNCAAMPVSEVSDGNASEACSVITATVNPDQTIQECDYDNTNTGAGGGPVDLEIENVYSDIECEDDGILGGVVEVTVRNTGCARIENGRIRLNADIDHVFDDRFVDLDPDETVTLWFPVSGVRTGCANCDVVFNVEADPDDEICECDGDNNRSDSFIVRCSESDADCCLRLEKEIGEISRRPDVFPVERDLYFHTDMAMYAASEFLETRQTLGDWMKNTGIDPNPERLTTGLFQRMIRKAGYYSLFNLGNVTMQSGLGLDAGFAPDVLEKAKAENISEKKAAEKIIAKMARESGLETVPDILPIVLEFYGGPPIFRSHAEHGNEKTRRYEWTKTDINEALTPSAWGMTLLRQANSLPQYLESGDPMERFIGRVMVWQMEQKVKLIRKHFVIEHPDHDGLMYLPHEFRFKKKEKGKEPEFEVKDENAHLLDQAAMLWGLSGLWSSERKVPLPEVTELIEIIWKSSEVLLYNKKLDTYADVRKPGDDKEKGVARPMSAMMIALALNSLSEENPDFEFDAEKKLGKHLDFLAKHMIAEDGGAVERFDLKTGKSTVGPRRLEHQASLVRALLVGNRHVEKALEVYQFMEETLWDGKLGIFREDEKWDIISEYTPYDIGLAIGALREVSLKMPESERRRPLDQMASFFERAVSQAGIQLEKDRHRAFADRRDIVSWKNRNRQYGHPRLAPAESENHFSRSGGKRLAPVLVRKIRMNLIPEGADGIEQIMNELDNRLEREAPEGDIFNVNKPVASFAHKNEFDTGTCMLTSDLLRRVSELLTKSGNDLANRSAYDAFISDPRLVDWFAYMLKEISRENLLHLTFHSRLGIPLETSDGWQQVAAECGLGSVPVISPIFIEFGTGEVVYRKGVRESFLAGGVRESFLAGGVRESFLADGVRESFLADGVRESFLADGVRESFLANGVRESFLANGWDVKTVESKVSLAGLGQVVSAQLHFMSDAAQGKTLGRHSEDLFFGRVMGIAIAEKLAFIDRVFGKMEENGYPYIPDNFFLVTDSYDVPLDIQADDFKTSLFSQVSLLKALGEIMFLDEKTADQMIPDSGNVRRLAKDLFVKQWNHVATYYLDPELHKPEKSKVMPLEAGAALDMLGGLYARMPETHELREDLKRFVENHAKIVADMLVKTTGEARQNDPETGKKTRSEVSLASQTAPILGLLRAAEALEDADTAKLKTKALSIYYRHLEDNLWDENLEVYTSLTDPVFMYPIQTVRYRYYDLDIGMTLAALAELLPWLDQEEKPTAYRHMTAFGERVLEAGGLEQYLDVGANRESREFHPQIIRQIDMYRTEWDRAFAGDMVRFKITVENICPDMTRRQSPLYEVTVRDHLPEGMAYVRHSSRLDGEKYSEPVKSGGQLVWQIPFIDSGDRAIITFRAFLDDEMANTDYLNIVNAEGWAGTEFESYDLICASESEEVHVTGGGMGKIEGWVFNDHGRDGTKGPGEPGLADVRIMLNGQQHAVTGAGGSFTFDGLVPGVYDLKIDPASVPSNLSPTTKTHRIIVLEEGGHEKINAGFADAKQVCGIVYDDKNDNDKKDKDEPGIHAVRVRISDTEHHAYSAEDGFFRIENVPAEMIEDVVIDDEQPYLRKKMEEMNPDIILKECETGSSHAL